MNVQIKGNVVDIYAGKIYAGELRIENGRVTSITPAGRDRSEQPGLPYLLPGFIDSHVHIESSMLIPSEFARLAVVHGTVATVSDPHEIANVCGVGGVEFMIQNGLTVPFKFNFGAPSCVPATEFETAGAKLNASDVTNLLQRPEIKYLSEMMNFPGVLNKDPEVLKKIKASRDAGKPVDGHAPGLTGLLAKKYIDAGISTDHECFTREEALGKLEFGMKILIREGSAARNFEALIDLLNDFPQKIMFCSDDKHPDSLVAGHINELCARAVARGIDIFKILRAACINPVEHYRLDVGLMRKGDPADFIIVKNLKNFEVIQTFIDGILVAEKGRSKIRSSHPSPINHFSCTPKKTEDFVVLATGFSKIPVIEALEGQLITGKFFWDPRIERGQVTSDPANDILKIVVVNRYRDAPVAKGFIKNMGLKSGAIASSVAHDSHNIVAVGVDDQSLCKAINLIIDGKGGIALASYSEEALLTLPVGGLMSDGDGYEVAASYTKIDALAKKLGSKLAAPFMTLSFMALLVIPHLKLSDLGLFNGDEFQLINSAK